VASDGAAILGNFDHVDRAAQDLPPDAPVLRIRGKSVFGNVEISMKLATPPAPDEGEEVVERVAAGAHRGQG
jgi:hypothetical protein